jgi:parallel beta-helix repeat protein
VFGIVVAVVLFVLAAGLIVNYVFNAQPSGADSSLETNTQSQSVSKTANPEFVTPQTPPLNAILVPDNFGTIQAAVANAVNGDAIYVRAGHYNESVFIDRAVWLIGENQTVIDANSQNATILICHDAVNVTGFTLRNTPTPATGSWIEQMQGIGVSKQLPDIQIINAQHCCIYANNLTNSIAAVQLINASQNTIINNYFLNNAKGVQFTGSSGNTAQNNFFVGFGMAISFENQASANYVVDNTVTNATYGVFLDSSSGNTLRNNTLTHNLRGFGVKGTSTSDFINTVYSSNTVDGKPIYYLVGASDKVVPQDAGAVVLVDCINMVVENATLPLGSTEITLVNTNNSIVKANTIANMDPVLLNANHMPQPPMHIYLYQCFNNDLEGNEATIVLDSSCGNRLTANYGLMNLYHSDGNTINANNLSSRYFDVHYTCGVGLSASSYNIIKQNNITSSGAGILMNNGASHNEVIENQIVGNTGGIMIIANQGAMFNQLSISDPALPRFNQVYVNNISGNANQGLLDSGYCTQIIGNTFAKNSNCGLDMMNSQSVSVIGNVIDGLNMDKCGNGTRNVFIVANNVTCNSQYHHYCVWLVTAYPVTFYHNNFFGPINFSHYADNYKNSTVPDAVACIWDNGSQGNYWSSYQGTDIDGDGIGDTVCPLGFGYYDSYPLIAPYDISQATSPP